MPSATALQQLETVASSLASCHRELAQILAAEKEGKIRTWIESQESTVSARDRQADFNVLGLSLDAIKLKGEIAALEAERSYLLILVEHGN